MGDPYYRYNAAAAADRGSVSRSSFPDYLSSEARSSSSCPADMQINQSQHVRYGVNDISISGVYPEPDLGNVSTGATKKAYPPSLGDPNSIDEPSNFGDLSAGAAIRGSSSTVEVPNLVGQRWDASLGYNTTAGHQPEPCLAAVSAGASLKGFSSPIEDPNPVAQRQDAPVGISPSDGSQSERSYGPVLAGANTKGYSSSLEDPNLIRPIQNGSMAVRPGIHDAVDEMHVHASKRNADGQPVTDRESNILFVDGLPTNCTRREVGHLFRPFVGYKDIKVVHKEPRRSRDRAMVLCFVEFHDPNYAMTAMQALQGYKFDDKKPDSPVLRIQFAHFPFRYQTGHDAQQAEFRR